MNNKNTTRGRVHTQLRVSEKLKRIRKQIDATQSEFALMLNLSPRTYPRIEQENTGIGFDKIEYFLFIHPEYRIFLLGNFPDVEQIEPPEIETLIS